MHSVTRGLAAAVGSMLLLGLPPSAWAAGPPGEGEALCNPVLTKCQVSVITPPRGGYSAPGANDETSDDTADPVGDAPASDPACQPELLIPQPPKSDPVWAGRTTGAIYVAPQCVDGKVVSWIPDWSWSPTPPPAPTVTPAELAQQALASLTLPKLVLHRSPPETNSDAGVPYTWVNQWTWFWTSPQSWQELSKTASLGAVSATVTVEPVELKFEPGDGQAAVTCAGPGRPWTESDGNAAPSDGGCGYRYRSVSNAVSPTVSIQWAVRWTGPGGAGGTLPELTTQMTSPPFKVEQIQVVKR